VRKKFAQGPPFPEKFFCLFLFVATYLKKTIIGTIIGQPREDYYLTDLPVGGIVNHWTFSSYGWISEILEQKFVSLSLLHVKFQGIKFKLWPFFIKPFANQTM
jgi:hypothetical protein